MSATLPCTDYASAPDCVLMKFSGRPNDDPWIMPNVSIDDRIRQFDWGGTSLGPFAHWPEHLRSAVDLLLQMPTSALLLHGQERIALYNDASVALLDVLHSGMLGVPLSRGWPEMAANAEAAIDLAFAGTGNVMKVAEFTFPRGGQAQTVCLELSLAPIPMRDGLPFAILVLMHDVTGNLRQESVLRRDAAKFEALFEQAQVGLCELSLTCGFVRVNNALCRLLGRPREVLMECGVPDVTHRDDIGTSLAAVGRLIEDGIPVSLDKRYVRSDGAIVWANSSISRLDPVLPGGPFSLLVVTVDLTERTLAKQALAENEARFRALAEASPVLIWQVNPDGRFAYLNPKCHVMFGSAIAQESVDWESVVHPDDAQAYLGGLLGAQCDRRTFQARARVRTSNGSVRWLESYTAPWFRGDGDYAGHVGISIDITDAVEAQEQLLVANDRLNLAIDGSGDGVWDWNIVTDEITYSSRMRDIFGLDEKLESENFDSWLHRVHPDDRPHTIAILHDCLEGIRPSYTAEYRMRCKLGMWKWIVARAIVVARDDTGKALRMTGTVTDISDERQSQEVIWLHANFDALTGLPNRRLFRDRLAHEVIQARRTGASLGLLFIDLDNFNEANDLLGHDVGDDLLVQAARRIQTCVRGSDTVARLGGDEFTAIITQLAESHDAETIASAINAALVEPFVLGEEVIHLSGSIGITIFPADGSEPESLIRNADQAMYVAKNNGRNRFSYFTPAMQNEAQDRLRLIADLRLALAGDQLEVYYQPVVDLRSGRIVKAEALLRWHHPRLGFLMPSEFIPFAEESGLISEIGDWVFLQAAACSRRWAQRNGESFQIGVNRSPVQFMARPQGSMWPSYLADMDLPGSCISVEITEAVLLNASNRVSYQLQQYHDAGMQVAIDDFGTGYSSLAYLKKFDIDYLKIDQTFIRDMQHNEDDRAIVRSVTAMAHELGLLVIAEGIETIEQNDFLIAVGCDFGQGFHFSRPVPPVQFEHLLEMDRQHGGVRSAMVSIT